MSKILVRGAGQWRGVCYTHDGGVHAPEHALGLAASRVPNAHHTVRPASELGRGARHSGSNDEAALTASVPALLIRTAVALPVCAR